MKEVTLGEVAFSFTIKSSVENDGPIICQLAQLESPSKGAGPMKIVTINMDLTIRGLDEASSQETESTVKKKGEIF